MADRVDEREHPGPQGEWLEEAVGTVRAELSCAELPDFAREEAEEALARLGAGVRALRRVAQDWLNVMDFDGYDCDEGCDAGDPCPRCRCVQALEGTGGVPNG